MASSSEEKEAVPTTSTKSSVAPTAKKPEKQGPSSPEEDSNGPDDPIFSIPQKVDVGDTISVKQHILCFVVFVVFMLHVGVKSSAMFKVDTKGKNYQRSRTSPVNRWKQRTGYLSKALLEPLMAAMLQDANKTQDNICDLFLGSSSIPDSGWGMFAGKNYLQGEVIRTEYGHHFPPFVLDDHEEATQERPKLPSIPPITFLLKPHSLLSNVRWAHASSHSKVLSSLVATREIQEGEELFLSLADYPSSSGQGDYAFVESLPSLHDFSRADDLIRDARSLYFGVSNAGEQKTNTKAKPHASSNARWNRARQNVAKKKLNILYSPAAAKDINNGLKLLVQAVSRYDPSVARLLPTKVQELALYHIKTNSEWSYPSLLGSLKNQTVASLTKNAQCLSGIRWIEGPTEQATSDALESEQKALNSPSHHQVVSKSSGFLKGDIVSAVPLLAVIHLQKQHQCTTIGDDDERSCPSTSTVIDSGNCLPLPVSSLSSSLVSVCLLSDIGEHTIERSLANVEYRWSDSNINSIPSDVQSLLSKTSLSSEEESQLEVYWKKTPLSMTLDIVALKDMVQNETIVVYQPSGIPFVTHNERDI